MPDKEHDMTTATPTAPADRTRPKLAALDKSRAPRELELLGKPWSTLGEEHRRLFSQAIPARTAYAATAKLLEEARAKDARALTEAARNGKPDPGRKHEMAAIVAAESAYNLAEGLTNAANEAIRAVRAAINGDEGQKALEGLDARIGKTQTELAKHADQAIADLNELASLASIIELLEKTRKGKGFSTLITATVRRPEANHRGQPVDLMLILEQLRDFAPRIEQ